MICLKIASLIFKYIRPTLIAINKKEEYNLIKSRGAKQFSFSISLITDLLIILKPSKKSCLNIGGANMLMYRKNSIILILLLIFILPLLCGCNETKEQAESNITRAESLLTEARKIDLKVEDEQQRINESKNGLLQNDYAKAFQIAQDVINALENKINAKQNIIKAESLLSKAKELGAEDLGYKYDINYTQKKIDESKASLLNGDYSNSIQLSNDAIESIDNTIDDINKYKKAIVDPITMKGMSKILQEKYRKELLKINLNTTWSLYSERGSLNELLFVEFKGKYYLRASGDYGNVVFNTLRTTRFSRAEEVFNKLAIKMLFSMHFIYSYSKDKRDYYGYYIEVHVNNKDFSREYEAAELEIISFIIPADAYDSFMKLDISSQQLLDKSYVLINNERIELLLGRQNR